MASRISRTRSSFASGDDVTELGLGEVVDMDGECRSELASADRRQERDFVAGGQRGVPRGEFLVTRGHQRGAVACKLGRTGGVLIENLLDGRAFGEMDG